MSELSVGEFPPAREKPPVQVRPTAVIAVLSAALFLTAAAVLGVMFYTEKQHSTSVSSQLAEKEREVVVLTKKVSDLDGKLGMALEAQRKAEERLKNGDAVGGKCHDAARTMREADVAFDATKMQAAVKDVIVNC